MDFLNGVPRTEAIDSFARAPLEENSVRLLRLRPAKHNCPLEATLEVSSFPPNNTYEALSYVWGTSTPDYCIHLPEGKFGIRENLYSALVQLRKTDQERILWIDAICINQNDNAEKSRQVAKMGEIFRNAHTVLVWLGSTPDDRANALVYLGSIPKTSQDLKLIDQGGFGLMGIPAIDAADTDSVVSRSSSVLSEAIAAGVDVLFESNWFSRVWIVQEYILAKNILFHYGNQVLDENIFEQAVRFVVALVRTTEFSQLFRNINRVWILLGHRLQFRVLNSGRLRFAEPKQFFEQALVDFRYQDCGDDRDRVFGFLALSPNVLNIEPNYHKTTAEVYTDFAIKSLNYSTLFHAGLRRRGPTPDYQQSIVLGPDYLPSWCPDFRRYPEPWKPMYGNFFATTPSDFGLIGWSRPAENLDVLTAFGHSFDTMETIEPRNADGKFGPTSDPRSFFAIIDHLKTIRRKIARESYYPTKEKIEMALAVMLACGIPASATDVDAHPIRLPIKERKNWRILFENLWMNYIRYCVYPQGTVHKKILDIKDSIIPKDFTHGMTPEEKTAWSYHGHLAEVIQTHDIFRTKKGYFGLAPPGIEQGDQITVLSGHRTPFLIRAASVPPVSVELCCHLAHPREEGCTVQYFQVIGPCYVHGIMQGELYNDPSWQKEIPWIKKEQFPGVYVLLPAVVFHLI